MPNGRKLAARLSRRQQDWDNIKTDGVKGNSKMVNGYAFHKPGSEKK